MRRVFHARIARTHLDERIARSPIGAGASRWIDGQLVHLEELVLHHAFRDNRIPTHEFTIARDVLRSRLRIDQFNGQCA